MFVFHFTWDLGYFRFIPPEFPYSPGFMAFGHCVASVFLALAGVSLVLASRGGLKWRAFLKRLGMIAGAALAITISTFYLFPDSYIFFGILHCIAAASVVALVFLRAPLWSVAVAAGAIIVAPLLYSSPFFDAPLLRWVGLGDVEPRSNDWRAFFPWAGVTLAGVALGRAALRAGPPEEFMRWKANNVLARGLVLGGRHSLLVYLVHQPVLLAVVYVASAIAPPPPAEEAAYARACEAPCVASGAGSSFCARACACVVTGTKGEQIWQKVLKNSLDAAETARFEDLSRQCARAADQ
jgi:uncharacterized membrane protein